jgi:ubiquitin-protein ligase
VTVRAGELAMAAANKRLCKEFARFAGSKTGTSDDTPLLLSPPRFTDTAEPWMVEICGGPDTLYAGEKVHIHVLYSLSLCL